MALKLIEGWDHYTTSAQLMDKWTVVVNAVPSTNYLRFGYGKSCYLQHGGHYMHWDYGENIQTNIVGMAIRIISFQAGSGILTFYDGTSPQMDLYVDSSGYISARRDTTILGTSASPILTQNWYYIEFKTKIDNSVGTYEIKLDEETIVSGSGADTQATGNAYANRVQIRADQNWTELNVDDFYLCDDSGSQNNDFLGDNRVETLYPTGVGNYSQWTPSAGANWQNVDEVPPDEGTTYNDSDAVAEKDTYGLTDLITTAATIAGVQTNAWMRKDDAGVAKVKRLFYINSTDYLSSVEWGLLASWLCSKEIAELNPDTASAWTVSDINALEAGVQRSV
jgi:hypothetical protein